MTLVMLVRTLVALVVASIATAASLLAVVWMSNDPPARERETRSSTVAYELVPPPDDLLPETSVETVAPATITASAPTPIANATSPATSALASDSLAEPVPSAIGGLPMLDSGLPMPTGTPTLPTTTDTGGVDTPARPLLRPSPRYPRQALKRGVEGHVIVRLRIDDRGRVADVVVVEGTPPGVFDDVAIETAKTYRFSPARKGGKAVATTVQQRIVFQLRR